MGNDQIARDPVAIHTRPYGSLTVMRAVMSAMLVVCLSMSVRSAPLGVAAIVDGHTITMDQVRAVAISIAGFQARQQLSDAVLLDWAAKQAGLTPSSAEIGAKVDEIRKKLLPATLEDSLAQRHMTQSSLEGVIRQRIEADRLAAKAGVPSDKYLAQLRQSSGVPNISDKDIEDRAFEMAGPVVISQLINSQLIEDEAALRHVTVTEAEVDAKVQEIRDRTRPKSLDTELQDRHMTMQFMRDSLRQTLLESKLSGKTKPRDYLDSLKAKIVNYIDPATK